MPGVIIDQPVRSLDEEDAISDAERAKVAYWRKKVGAAGVSDVRLPPTSSKLSEREIRIMNATFERLSAGKLRGKVAASLVGRAYLRAIDAPSPVPLAEAA